MDGTPWVLAATGLVTLIRITLLLATSRVILFRALILTLGNYASLALRVLVRAVLAGRSRLENLCELIEWAAYFFNTRNLWLALLPSALLRQRFTGTGAPKRLVQLHRALRGREHPQLALRQQPQGGVYAKFTLLLHECQGGVAVLEWARRIPKE